ncbi:MAG: glycosyltransferase family 2 protein [Planctomycetes bacterium]|nr:glycosyltransferase family 2 protein [Planctomycetota bacterium]
MVEVVAIVPNWRQPEPTLQVVADLAQCGHADLRTVVVDDGSGDDSAERLAVALRELPRAELLALPANRGYCAAMNAGIARARELDARFVLFLNNDVRLPAGFLAPLVACLRDDPDLAVVGPTIVSPDGRCWSQGGDVVFRPNLVRLRNQGGEPAPTTAGPEAVRFLPGACALYRADHLVAAGGIDERYWMYWEDVDLGDRLRGAGHKVAWIPWVRIVHEGSRSSGGGRSPLRKYASAVNTVHWLRQHGSVRDWLAFWLCDVLLYPLTFVAGTGPRAALAKGRGLWDGLRGRQVDGRALGWLA